MPRGDAGLLVLQTLLYKIKSSVKTLSIRFNMLTQAMKEYFIEWVGQNGGLETLYVMGSGFEGPLRTLLENAWKKHQFCHRTENNGNTLIRVPDMPALKTDGRCLEL